MNDVQDIARRQAETLISGLSKTVGIEEICFDDDWECYLAFDDHPVIIGFDEEAGYMTLQSPVMDVPLSPSSEFYSWVLEDNYISFANGIGCLALDRNAEKIVWLDRRPAKDLDQIAFEEWLSKSVDRAEYWVRQLYERVNSAELATNSQEENVAPSDVVFRP